MTDWYQTITSKKVAFTARTIVEGVFAKALYDKAIWQKYASMDPAKAHGWAPMPDYVLPVIELLTPTADKNDNFPWNYNSSQSEASRVS